MRTLINRVLMWVLGRVLPAHGHHRTAAGTASAPADPWIRSWTTPDPRHVIERHTPLRGEDTHLVRPYATLDDTLRLRTIRPRPRRVLVHMAQGPDMAGLPGAPG